MMNQSDCTSSEDIKTVIKKIDDLYSALMGDSLRPKGIAQTQQDHELRIKVIETKLSNYTYLFFGVFLSGGGVGAAIVKFMI